MIRRKAHSRPPTFSSGAVVPRAFSRRCVSEAGEVPSGALLGNGRLPKPEEKLSNSSGLVITVATEADAPDERPASFAPLSESNPRQRRRRWIRSSTEMIEKTRVGKQDWKKEKKDPKQTGIHCQPFASFESAERTSSELDSGASVPGYCDRVEMEEMIC